MAQTEPNEASSSEKRNQWHKYHHGPGIILIFVLIIAAVFAFGLFVSSAARLHVSRQLSSFSVNRRAYSVNVAGPGLGFSSGQNLANQDTLEGVVTAVNGSSLTIAGDGATNTIQTNSSTHYFDGSSPAINDTVIVEGTLSSNTFTANRIDINPVQ